MAKHSNFPEKQTWGTCEELLLACAVHRYGTESWDAVAEEIQKRTSTIHPITPHSCQQKFQDLRRRFEQNSDVSEADAEATDAAAVPWLEQLRKLRVAELRREVERYDLSIVSLQLKLKKLTEERERNSERENEKETEKSDLVRDEERNGNEAERKNTTEPESGTGKPVIGEESDRENRSVNESNSTDSKDESPGTGPEEAKEETKPGEPDGAEPDRGVDNREAAGEDSCNGSCDSAAKESATHSERVNAGREAGESPESVAESKGEEGIRESSDVQSSASLSKKKKQAPKKREEPEGPDELEGEGQRGQSSPAIKGASAESQPLIDFLEILRSDKLGSHFERRLPSQETSDYKNLVRQHLDFETVRTRLEEGWYTECRSKFFRDLLLILNNAVVFFGKKSSEYMAAVDLRQLVCKEMLPKATVLPKEELASVLPAAQLPIKPDPEPPQTLAIQSKLSVPLIACRKRSSIAAKAATSSSVSDKRRQQTAALMDEDPVVDRKAEDKPSDKNEQNRVTKQRTRERSIPNVRKGTKNAKSQTNTNANKNLDASSGLSSKGATSNENTESKSGKEKGNTNSNSKKRSAANFLNRMKKSSSSSSKGNLTETLKDSVTSPDNTKGDVSDKKKSGNRRGDSQKDTQKNQTPRTRSGTKNAKEQGKQTKNTGRPPRRAAAPSATPSSVTGKRGREIGEAEAGSGHTKKRAKK